MHLGIVRRLVSYTLVLSLVMRVIGLHAGEQGSQPRGATRRAELEQRLNVAVAHFATATKVPGLAVGVIADGQVFLSDARGVVGPADSEKRPVDRQTVFHLASLAKPFVATAVMALIEQKKLRLDDTVIKHLVYFRLADERFSEITIRQLLTHVSGLPDVADYEWANPQHDVGALERYVRSLASVGLRSAPGEKYAYTNIGYEVLGDVIAKASGRPFETYMADAVFRPLFMTSSTFMLPEVPRERLAMPSVRDSSGLFVATTHFPYNRIHAPSSTLYSTVDDMLRWLRANLRGGELDGHRILTADGYRVLFSEGVERSKGPIRSVQDLGWSTLILDGITVHGHGGHDRGFRASMLFAPQADGAVVVMTNGDADNVKVDSLGLQLLGIVVGRDWSGF